MQECKGIITRIIDYENGIIEDEQNQEYYFSKVNFNKVTNIEIGDKVKFDYIIITTQNAYTIYKAINIEKI